jgi:hypothetical protein
MAMGKAKRKQLAKLTVSQELRELNLAYKEDVRKYQGSEIPVHVIYEHRANRLQAVSTI